MSPMSEAVSPLSGDDINLLGKHGIVRDRDGAWFHIETKPSGQKIITPVDPNAELHRLRQSQQGDVLLSRVAQNAIEQFEIATQAIIKKVALNPTVFWIYQYVTTINDPNTGFRLFDGDLGDFLSFCVRFTGEAYYGVAPSRARI